MTSSHGSPPSRRPRPTSSPGTAGATILVVGADPAPRSVAAGILQQAGYVVVEAGGLEAAREIWEVHHPEVAVVDLDRPGHPGSLSLSHLWVPQLDTAVIVTTRSDDLKLAEDAFAQGAYGYVGKPHTSNGLVIQVMSALRRASWSAPSPTRSRTSSARCSRAPLVSPGSVHSWRRRARTSPTKRWFDTCAR